jgi:hypothetical protein
LLLHVESPSLLRIVASLDVVKDIGLGLGSSPVVSAIHAFTFEHTEKALGGSVIGTK